METKLFLPRKLAENDLSARRPLAVPQKLPVSAPDLQVDPGRGNGVKEAARVEAPIRPEIRPHISSERRRRPAGGAPRRNIRAACRQAACRGLRIACARTTCSKPARRTRPWPRPSGVCASSRARNTDRA